MAILKRSALAAVTLLCLIGPTRADQLSEHEVKAAFLVNFARFIEWPAVAFSSGKAPFLIAVIGDDPFGRDLDEAIRGKVIEGRYITVKRIDWRDDARNFQIVFLSTSEKRRIGEILRPLEGTSTVTVSDIEGFCAQGGVITFINDKDRIRFTINVDAATRQGVKISSRLLSLAQIYRNGE